MSRKGMNIKIVSSKLNKKEEDKSKAEKGENSLEINSYSISEQKINDNIIGDNLIQNDELLNENDISEQKEEPKKRIKEKEKEKENSSSNRTIKFRNSRKITINNTETNTNTNADLVQKTERIFKKKRKSSIVKTIEEDQEYIETDENQTLTLRQKLSHFFEENNRLFYIRIVVSLLTTLSYIYYVICTYKPELYESLNYIDYFICISVIIEHVVSILAAHYISKYLISFESFMNFFIEIPPFFSLLCDDYSINKWYRFINITRVFRLTKCYIITEIYQKGEKSVKSQILNIILSILLIIFIFAGVVQMLDYENVIDQLKLAYSEEKRYFLNLRKHYHHYLYFIIVSLTTVGYGDITPISILSQFTMVVFIVFILAVIPNQTDELITLSNAQTIYERNEYISNPDIPFIVLLGNIELDILKSFCEEYFHADHGIFYRHIVILKNEYPHREFEYFLMEKENNKFIHYLQGDPLKEENLMRADILKAKSCIIFSDKNARDLSIEDQKTIFLALYIKKFYYTTTLDNLIEEKLKSLKEIESLAQFYPKKLLKGNSFKIFLQLNKTESPKFYYGALQHNYKKYMAKDQLFIIENLKMNLLSKSCVTPGIISLLYNLMISASTGKINSKNEPEWIREYTEGTQYEIYKFSAEGELLKSSYPQLAIDIFNKFHSLLIALEINYKGHSLIKLNPQTTETISDLIEKNFNTINTITNDSIEDDEESKTEKLKKILKMRNYIKVYLYLISKDKEVIEELQKIDNTKVGISALKSRYRRSLAKSNTYKYNNDKKNLQNSTERNLKSDFNQFSYTRNIKRTKTKVSTKEEEYSDSDESSSSEEELDTKKVISEILDNLDKKEEKEKIINNYYTIEGLENNHLTNDIEFQDIKDRRDIKDHVVICGMDSEIIHFILPLRAKYLTKKMLKWIVILSPYLPKEIQDILSIFPKIIYIKGDPLYPENLNRCNIATAEIAVILGNNSSNSFDEVLEDNSKNENDEDNITNDYNKIKMDEQFSDSSTLFIYNSIRKINHSIKIITELLFTNNIEFLLSSKYLQKLHESYNSKSSNSFTNSDNNKLNYKTSPNYELTPVFASGEIYLPSLGDKILAQMFFNSNLLTIINLILEGDKNIMKKKEQKLYDMFKLTGSNLFLIPCEIKNESFGELFKRMITKNGILCIALYRKNLIDNFYYVYTNPRKTTLIKDTDYIFVLAGTQNIDAYFEKNDFKSNKKNEKEKEDEFNNRKGKDNKSKPAFFQVLQKSIQKHYLLLKNNKNNIDNSINKEGKDINLENMNINNIDEDRKFADNEMLFNEKINTNKNIDVINIAKSKSENNYKEVEELQNQVNKTMEKLKLLNINVNEFKEEMDSFIKKEVKNELLVYLNKVKK